MSARFTWGITSSCIRKSCNTALRHREYNEIHSVFFAKKTESRIYSTIINGSAVNLNATNPATATIRKIHLTSLPFHLADFILNEKKRILLTIRKEKKRVMPRQVQ